MGRRVSLVALANEKVEDIPGRSAPTLVRLRISQLAPTPLNPRRDFGSDTELNELGESMKVRQLQPVVAVSRAAYLKLWPEHEDAINSADFVLANGERRFRAARHVELDGIDVLVREEVADSRTTFLDAVLTENLDRKNFDPIEEALAVAAMVGECGSAKKAAAQFRRHESWVSQRRALLKLTPELQECVRSAELPVRIARSIASLPPDQQELAWRKAQAEQEGQPGRQASVPGQRTGREAPSAGDEQELAAGEAEFTAVKKERSRAPGQRHRNPEPLGDVPWQSPEALAALIKRHLASQHIPVLIQLLQDNAQSQEQPA